MDVVAAPERLDQCFVLRHVLEHPQFDLRVVRRDQHVAGLGDEGPADFAAERRLDRDVLQVRIAAAQASGRRACLVERRMDAARLGVDELRQRVDVRAFELHQRAPLEDVSRQVVRQRQLLEHFHRRRRRARRPGALQHRQLHLVEQDVRQLLR